MQSTWLGWFFWLIGFDASRIPPDAEKVEFIWTNMPTSWGVFVLIAAVVAIAAAVIFLYLREIDTCPRGVKLLLAAFRFATLLLLVVIFLGPALRYAQLRTREPYVLVMRDASQSMNTADKYVDEEVAQKVAEATGKPVSQVQAGVQSRAQLVDELLQDVDFQLLRNLQRRGNVRVLDFSSSVDRRNKLSTSMDDEASGQATPIANKTPDPSDKRSPRVVGIAPLVADGRATDLWAAVKESLSYNPLAAVVLFTDGQHTTDEDPREIAAQALEKGVRLYIVGVGDPSRTRNLRLAEIYVRPKVWPNEPFEIDAALYAEGIGGREVEVELIEQKAPVGDGQPGAPSTVERRRVTIPEGGGRIRTTFAHTLANPGQYIYTVRVDSVDGEQTLDDNQVTSSVLEVVDQKVKVLLIAGAPTWEYRMVQRLLRRDDSISVSCWLQTLDIDRPQEGDEPINKLPRTLAELSQYHVIMLFDPNPDEFDEQWLDALKQFAEKQAGGVLYMAGPKYTGLFLTLKRTSGLKDILPVSFGDVGESEVARLLTTNNQAWPLRIVVANVDHPIMTFTQDPGETLAVWENLPGIYWSFPSQGAKPTTKVLVEHSDPTLPDAPRPLLVTGRYGSANTVYMGFNGTWRWRRIGQQAEFFDKFWIQVTRFLVETRSLQGRRRGFVEPEKDRYEIGDRVVLTARLLNPAFDPLDVPEVEATLRAGDGEVSTVVFRKRPGPPGQYETTLTARETGIHEISLTLGDSGSDQNSVIKASFRVEIPSVEADPVWLNEKLLRETADASGGKYYNVNQLAALADDIPDATEEIEVPGKPEPLWDLRGVLLVFVVLLSVEWAVRKGFKLL